MENFKKTKKQKKQQLKNETYTNEHSKNIFIKCPFT